MLRIELLPGIVILFVALARSAADLVTFGYDWDLDHMMYFGGRLLAGELHWTVEYDDKLPVVQALFALPAKAQSIRGWQVMSALGILGGCVSAYLFLIATIRDCFPEVRTRNARGVGFCCAALIAHSFALLPGGITHINPMAASFAMMSIALADAARREFPSSRARCCGAFLLGAFAASMAIGIRPYFLYPLVLAGVWSALKVDRQPAGIGRPPPTTNRHLTAAQVVCWGICWILCTGLFGLAANALPYLMVGRLDVLLAGLTMLSQDLNPEGVARILERQYSVLLERSPALFVLAVVSSGVAIVRLPRSIRAGSWRENHRGVLDVGYLVILCPLLLEIAILNQHFWSHYIQMFVPFICIGVGLLAADLAAKGRVHASRARIAPLAIACSIMLFVSDREEVGASLRAISEPHSQRHSQEKKLERFRTFLETRPASERDFLNATGMYFHWRLGEPRHGFPHAANTRHVVSRGWWQHAKVPEPFDLPTSRAAYCSMLEANGPSLVVELGETDVIECFLENADSRYSRVEGGPSTRGLVIFERNSDRDRLERGDDGGHARIPGLASRNAPPLT